MFRIVRTRTLRQFNAQAVESHERADRAEQALKDLSEAHKASASEQQQDRIHELAQSLGRAEGALEILRAQHLLDTEDRAALRLLLRIARKQARPTDRVFVLFRHGKLHSLHPTQDSAEIAAEAEGAPRSGWTADAPGAAFPPASEVSWRIQQLPFTPPRRPDCAPSTSWPWSGRFSSSPTSSPADPRLEHHDRPGQQRLPGVSYRTETYQRLVPHTVDGKTNLVEEDYTIEVPVPEGLGQDRLRNRARWGRFPRRHRSHLVGREHRRPPQHQRPRPDRLPRGRRIRRLLGHLHGHGWLARYDDGRARGPATPGTGHSPPTWPRLPSTAIAPTPCTSGSSAPESPPSPNTCGPWPCATRPGPAGAGP
ncbi:hypothetical protein NKH18_01270 [Streptomyces sp. M10(2022)]